ncbi:MAG: peptidylprolyl isomerase [Candidatus Kapabacteria bacterium]|nr:peptidylprolyl isomerase [Candidatus Kapabacteria bacterium]
MTSGYFLCAVCVAALLATLTGTNANAQEQPKPQYRIEARRGGVPIGAITLELYPLIAPKAVRNFDSLVAIRFYDTTAFHRVIPGFMIQGGDPNSRSGNRTTWGTGNPNQSTVPAEFSAVPYVRGTLGAARSTDINSATSQFFICVATASHLNGNYTVYGRAISGMAIADSIVLSPRDARDNPNVKIEMFVTKTGVNDSVPHTPVLQSPAMMATKIGASQQLSWQPVAGAVLYHVEVALDSQFTEKVFTATTATPQASASGILLGMIPHYWRVRANNGGFYSPYSRVYSFTSAITAPALSYPDSGATNTDTTLRIGWNATRGAVTYRVQVATSALYSSAAMVYQNLKYADTSIVLSGLQRGKRYYWRIGGNAPDHTGDYSRSRIFTTQSPTSVVGADDAAAPLRIDPQPASEIATVRFSTPTGGDISIVITDMTGRTVTTLPQGILGAGSYSVAMNTHAMAGGVYSAELRSSGGAIISRVLFSVVR